jgi:hypothetical protein
MWNLTGMSESQLQTSCKCMIYIYKILVPKREKDYFLEKKSLRLRRKVNKTQKR